ncbi:hypothetical protein [Mycolicibacterium sediminis]|uniref:Chitin-binding protein n=1 Tax=Mycolicibacterium sediminis TaxID=1286180 RepID=A0A7I7QUJ8_9MYCO|nr:hypothetical protein [Mycolicibacterium sediminis]BBY29657.1 hypothetical protein MSEDJ_37530 [Mycolicibacterium sediminis]
MTFTRALGASTIALGVGLGALLGAGSASADPGRPCNAPGAPTCQDQGPNRAPAGWQNRGPDQGRRDHQPFNWNGQQVTPMQAGNGAGWGFWFLGTWIPL